MVYDKKKFVWVTGKLSETQPLNYRQKELIQCFIRLKDWKLACIEANYNYYHVRDRLLKNKRFMKAVDKAKRKALTDCNITQDRIYKEECKLLKRKDATVKDCREILNGWKDDLKEAEQRAGLGGGSMSMLPEWDPSKNLRPSIDAHELPEAEDTTVDKEHYLSNIPLEVKDSEQTDTQDIVGEQQNNDSNNTSV